MAYVELLDLKTYLGVTEDDDDALLVSLIDRAQAIFDGQTNRTFEATADTTRRFDAIADVDGATLLLDRDLCSITTITNGDSTTVSDDDYVTEPRNTAPYYAITLKASSGLCWTYVDDPENAITISGKWAYSSSAPYDIVDATIRLAVYLYRIKDANTWDVVAAPEYGTLTIPGGMPRDVRLLLAPYVRRT